MRDIRLFKTYGFTLIEIMIASGLLSLFLASAFALYQSSVNSFISGSWRLEEQKRLQNVMSALSRDLSSANPKMVKILSDGSHDGNSINTPIYINSLMVSKNKEKPTFLNVAGNEWKCLMVFSISYPAIEANSLIGVLAEKGKWSGISVWAKNRKLFYLRTGSPDKLFNTPDSIPPTVVGIPVSNQIVKGQSFEPDAYQNRAYTYETSLQEVTAIRIENEDDKLSSLELIFRSVRYANNKKTESEIAQSIIIQLASQSTIVEF